MMNLSKAEYPVVELTAKGFSEKEIADKLCVSPHTVRNHKARICKKLGARNAVDIARMFILSLDNPKQYFAALTFLVIQFHIVLNLPAMELRKVGRQTVRVVKTAKRKNNEYIV